MRELMDKLGLVGGASSASVGGASSAVNVTTQLNGAPGPPSLVSAAAGVPTHGGVHAPLPPIDVGQEGAAKGGQGVRVRLEGFMTQAAAVAASLGELPTPSSAWPSLIGSETASTSATTAAATAAGGSDPGGSSADAAIGGAGPGRLPDAPNYLDQNSLGTGDYVHPLLRLLMARQPPAYVLDPRAHKLSASGDDAPEGGDGGGTGTGKGSTAVKRGPSGLGKGSGAPRPPVSGAATPPIAMKASTPPPQPAPSDSAPSRPPQQT